MGKLRVKWTPKFEQDFDAMTDDNSPFYDEELVEAILKDYASIEDFKASGEYLQMEKSYYESFKNKQ